MMLKIISNQYDLLLYKCITGNVVPLNLCNSASVRLENIVTLIEGHTIPIYHID